MTLDLFQKLTLGAPYRVARRSMIRKLTYWAIIPFYLEDYTSRALDDYTIDNEVCRENNQAFTNATKRLFDFLHSWSPELSLSLGIEALAYSGERHDEPETEETDLADRHCEDFEDGKTRTVLPYRAQLDGEVSLVQLPIAKSALRERREGLFECYRYFHVACAADIHKSIKRSPTTSHSSPTHFRNFTSCSTMNYPGFRPWMAPVSFPRLERTSSPWLSFHSVSG